MEVCAEKTQIGRDEKKQNKCMEEYMQMENQWMNEARQIAIDRKVGRKVGRYVDRQIDRQVGRKQIDQVINILDYNFLYSSKWWNTFLKIYWENQLSVNEVHAPQSIIKKTL